MAIVFMVVISSVAAVFRGYQLHGDCYTTAFCYVFAKLASDLRVNLVVIKLRIRWLPLATIAIGAITGGWGALVHSAIGFLAGHVTFCILFVWPVVVGRPLLRVPRILCELCGDRRLQRARREAWGVL